MSSCFKSGRIHPDSVDCTMHDPGDASGENTQDDGFLYFTPVGPIYRGRTITWSWIECTECQAWDGEQHSRWCSRWGEEVGGDEDMDGEAQE